MFLSTHKNQLTLSLGLLTSAHRGKKLAWKYSLVVSFVLLLAKSPIWETVSWKGKVLPNQTLASALLILKFWYWSVWWFWSVFEIQGLTQTKVKEASPIQFAQKPAPAGAMEKTLKDKKIALNQLRFGVSCLRQTHAVFFTQITQRRC